MIPIFFDDPTLGSDMERVSQIFVSDKAGRQSHKKDTFFVRRTDSSINCQSSLPFIAILLDLNHDGKRKLKVTFEQNPDNDRCLRIYASGLDEKTFPFLHPGIARLLQDLISKPKEPTSGARLRARVKYGRTAKVSHMRWEDQNVG